MLSLLERVSCGSGFEPFSAIMQASHSNQQRLLNWAPSTVFWHEIIATGR